MKNTTTVSKYSSDTPSVSVVIPAFKCAQHIGDCLKAVAAQTYRGDLDVTVALAPSCDNTEHELDEMTSRLAVSAPKLPIRIVDNPKVNTSTGLNTAIANSDGRIVARVDAQSRIPPDYIEKAVTTMIRTKAANVGGIQRPDIKPAPTSHTTKRHPKNTQNRKTHKTEKHTKPKNTQNRKTHKTCCCNRCCFIVSFRGRARRIPTRPPRRPC